MLIQPTLEYLGSGNEKQAIRLDWQRCDRLTQVSARQDSTPRGMTFNLEFLPGVFFLPNNIKALDIC